MVNKFNTWRLSRTTTIELNSQDSFFVDCWDFTFFVDCGDFTIFVDCGDSTSTYWQPQWPRLEGLHLTHPAEGHWLCVCFWLSLSNDWPSLCISEEKTWHNHKTFWQQTQFLFIYNSFFLSSAFLTYWRCTFCFHTRPPTLLDFAEHIKLIPIMIFPNQSQKVYIKKSAHV